MNFMQPHTIIEPTAAAGTPGGPAVVWLVDIGPETGHQQLI